MVLPELPGPEFEYRPEYGQWVTPKLTKKRPIYNWYLFPHSYDRILVHKLLDEFEVQPNALVYDPFVGAGTTTLACKERGISAIGTDLLPLSALVSKAKIQDYDSVNLKRTLDGFSFKRFRDTPDAFADVALVQKAFRPALRRRISELYWQIQAIPDEAQRLFFLVGLLGLLIPLSKTARDGGWPRIVRDKEVPESAVKVLFLKRMKTLIKDVESQSISTENDAFWMVKLADARNVALDQTVDLVISSPPYLNRHDYTRVFALELALAFVETATDLIQLRYQTLRSHVEAQAPELNYPHYNAPASLQDPLETIALRAEDARILPMITGYFEDLYAVLVNLSNLVRSGGRIAFVLGNVRFCGVTIPVDRIVADIGQLVGFQLEKIIIARYRGNSAQQMGQFGREPARESIILWRKVGRSGD
jgi:tRNA G10  N-methylase Trm11